MAAPQKKQVVADDQHMTLIQYVNEAETYLQDSQELSERCRDYYDSKQWSDAEVRKLRRQKQAPVVINRIKPKMDALMGMEEAGKTTAKALPRNPQDEYASEAATEGIRYVLEENSFDKTASLTWENDLIEGTGGCEIIVKPRGDGFDILIKHIMWDRIIWDPYSRRKDFNDAHHLGQVVWMDYDEAVDLYPDAQDVLENMQASNNTYEDKPRWMDNTRRRVKIVELYWRKANGEIWYACFTRGGYCVEPKKSPYQNENGESEWPYEFSTLFVTREGYRYGAVRQLLDVQDEINKRRSKALHLMSVRQVRGERGAVEDVNKARAELARPDGYIETTPGMEFEVLKTGDMATAQFQLLQEAKNEIDSVGANAAIQGKDSGVQSGVALRTREQSGRVEVGPMFAVHREWQHRVFRKVWNRIRQYWKAPMWIRITDDPMKVRFVGLNQQMTRGEQMLYQAQQRGAQPEELQAMQQQIASDPDAMKPVTHNEVAKLDVDIIITDVPDVLTSQSEDFTMFAEMVKSGLQIPAQAVIEASPLANKDRILKLMKESPQIPPQLQKQMQAQQEAMQKLQKQAQALAQENQTLKQNQQTDLIKIQQQGAMKVKEAQDNLALEQQRIQNDAQLAEWKAKLDAATKITVAQISAKGSLTETQIRAESDANVALATAFGDQQTQLAISKNDTESGGSTGISATESSDMGETEPNTPIGKLTQMHQESQASNSEQMQQFSDAMTMIAQAFQGMAQSNEAILQALTRPKEIMLHKRDGGISGATVQ